MVAVDEILSGRYLLKDELGTGGMGTVYRAIDLRTGAAVAVKVPHPMLVRDPVYVERLRREAQLAASLTSPRVAHVTDFAEHEGTPYLVMEYVPGETLADRIERDGPLPADEALHVAHEIARALDAAHQRGISHRDLKPQNVRLDGMDVKVLDFGIARAEGLRGLTAPDLLVGSPEYLAPERGETAGDIRADIYSLGIIMYQMLSGRVPFDGGTPWGLLRRHATEPPAPLPPGLPPAVYPLVDRCLAKDPAGRYQTPHELTTALQDALRTVDPRRTVVQRVQAAPGTDLDVAVTAPLPPARQTGGMPAVRDTGGMSAPRDLSAPLQPRGTDPGIAASAPAWAPPPAGTPPTGAGGRRRGPAWWAYAAAGAVVVAVIALVLFSLQGGDDDVISEPPAQAGAGAGSGSGSPTSPPDSGTRPSLAVVFPADGSVVNSPVRIEVKASDVTLKPATERDPNGRHLHYFIDTDPSSVLGPGQPVPTGSQNIVHSASASLTADLGPGAHTIWVVMTDNDHIALSPPVQASSRFTVLGTPAVRGEQAPIVYQQLVDGRWQVFAMDGTGRNVRRLSGGNTNDIEPSWAPDGSKIAFVSQRDGRQHVYVMNPDGGGVRQLTRGDFDDHTPVWSPDGASIAFSSTRDGGREQLFVAPASGDGQVRQLTRGNAASFLPTWSPDGKQIAFTREQGSVTQIYIVDAGGGDPKQLTTDNERHIDPAWSPDGRRIAFSAFRDNRWNIFVINTDGSGLQKITSGDPQDRSPAWSPDGRQIVFVSGREGQQQIYILPLDGGQVKALTEGLTHNFHPSWPRR